MPRRGDLYRAGRARAGLLVPSRFPGSGTLSRKVAAVGAVRTTAGVPVAPTTLYDYGVIGNQHTAALVSRHGSVDWACFPRFDSPSVFGRLLDARKGGFHRVAPVEAYRAHQIYVPGTNVLTTFFELERRRTLTLTDFLPIGHPVGGPDGDARIIRRIQARGGPIDVGIDVDVQFDYARAKSEWSVEGDCAYARSGPSELGIVGPWKWSPEAVGVTSRGTLGASETAFAQAWWGPRPPAEPGPAALLGITDAFWRGWLSPRDAPLRRVAARWHPWVERSELVLKLLSPAGSGVFIAAPTTSLPESPHGSRNWDYRYVWLRDAAFTAQVFLLLGHVDEARAYVGWAVDRIAGIGPEGELRALYNVDGGCPPPEEELPHLSGFDGARPVRIGNAAIEQRQLDIYGEILDCAALLEQVDPAFVRDRWKPLERLAHRVVDLWALPDQGLWESREAPAHYVHSKLMSWVALDRAIRLAQAFGRTEPCARWQRIANEIHAVVLSRGFDDHLGAFVQAFDRPVLDACTLRVPLTGFLPPQDPRVLSTLEAVERGLTDGPFVRRYTHDDGFHEPEGAFLLCSFWLVEALARSGQTDKALERWDGLLDAAGPLLLFSEEFEPKSRIPLGNYPQAFTHIGLLRAALALGLVGTDR